MSSLNDKPFLHVNVCCEKLISQQQRKLNVISYTTSSDVALWQSVVGNLGTTF